MTACLQSAGLPVWLAEHAALVIAIIGVAIATAATRVLPMMFLSTEQLPRPVLRWLSFVPVAVLAALLGPDILMPDGKLQLSWHNLFLLVTVPALFIAWRTQSFFGTIAFGMGAVALARFLGWG